MQLTVSCLLSGWQYLQILGKTQSEYVQSYWVPDAIQILELSSDFFMCCHLKNPYVYQTFTSFLSLMCFFFFQLSKKWLELDNRADGMARGTLFLLLLHDEPRRPCHRLISRFLSLHSPLYWGKLGIKSLQANIQKQTRTSEVWALNMSQECYRNFVNVSSKLEAACFFSVLVTWVYLLIEIIVKSKDDKLHFSALLPLTP